MKIEYFDMTKFFVLKPFYEKGDYQLRNRLICKLNDFGRGDEHLE